MKKPIVTSKDWERLGEAQEMASKVAENLKDIRERFGLDKTEALLTKIKDKRIMSEGEWTQNHTDAQRWIAENMGRDYAMADAVDSLAKLLHSKVEEAFNVGQEIGQSSIDDKVEMVMESSKQLAEERKLRGEVPTVEEAMATLDAMAENCSSEATNGRDVHGRLTDLVDETFGYRPTMGIEALLDVLEKELPSLKAKAEAEPGTDYDQAYAAGFAEAIALAVEQCEGEKAACERHHRAMPRATSHKIGIQIASVCAHRVRGLVSKVSPKRGDGQ